MEYPNSSKSKIHIHNHNSKYPFVHPPSLNVNLSAVIKDRRLKFLDSLSFQNIVVYFYFEN